MESTLGRRPRLLWSPTIRAGLLAGTSWLHVFCRGRGTSRAIDLRTLDRHPLASWGTLVLGLRCSWCPGSAPMPQLLGLYALPPAGAAQKKFGITIRGFWLVRPERWRRARSCTERSNYCLRAPESSRLPSSALGREPAHPRMPTAAASPTRSLQERPTAELEQSGSSRLDRRGTSWPDCGQLKVVFRGR
jgi:hypothetical protein